jgi:hypothetical protein
VGRPNKVHGELYVEKLRKDLGNICLQGTVCNAERSGVDRAMVFIFLERYVERNSVVLLFSLGEERSMTIAGAARTLGPVSSLDMSQLELQRCNPALALPKPKVLFLLNSPCFSTTSLSSQLLFGVCHPKRSFPRKRFLPSAINHRMLIGDD